MKIRVVSGCTADSLTVDGVDYYSLDPETQGKVVRMVLDRMYHEILSERTSLRNVIGYIQSDEDNRLSYCEQCGDTPWEEIYNFS